jgi:hypothetical protein
MKAGTLTMINTNQPPALVLLNAQESQRALEFVTAPTHPTTKRQAQLERHGVEVWSQHAD